MNNYPKKMIFKQTFLMVKMDKKASILFIKSLTLLEFHWQ